MARQQTAAQAASEGASRLGRFAGATQTKEAKSDPIGNIQKFAREEQERQRKKKEEEDKKKKQPVSTAPSEDGFLTRMYKKYVSGEK